MNMENSREALKSLGFNPDTVTVPELQANGFTVTCLQWMVYAERGDDEIVIASGNKPSRQQLCGNANLTNEYFYVGEGIATTVSGMSSELLYTSNGVHRDSYGTHGTLMFP